MLTTVSAEVCRIAIPFRFGFRHSLAERDVGDGVLLTDGVARVNGGRSAPILYENIGRSSDVPELHYVIPIERVSWDPASAHRAVVTDYVQRMEHRTIRHGVGTQQAGLGAYDVWIKALAGIQKILAYIRELDIQLKDLERGLVEFPAIIGGKEVFLCWEKDENDIEFWHDLETGFAGRARLPEA